MNLKSALIEIAALKSEREADKHEIRSLRDALVAVTKGHDAYCLCAGCESLRPF